VSAEAESGDSVSQTEQSSGRARGAGLILVATAVAGASTYILQAVVLSALSARDYLQFSIMWSVLYLVVGALAGIQQEVTRASRPVGTVLSTKASPAARFALTVAPLVFAIVFLSGLLWGPPTIVSSPVAVVALVAFGAASYVFVAVVSGTMYGLRRWMVLAALIMVDALLRVAFVIIAVWGAPGIVGLAAATVLPFPLAVGIVWLVVRRSVRGRSVLDVDSKTLAWNSARTVAAAAATAVMISGFPFLLGVTSPGQPVKAAAVIAVVTLTRAPLVIPALALQSFLVVHFRDLRVRVLRSLVSILAGIAAVAAGASLLAWWIGLDILHWFGKDFAIMPWEVALIVASAGFTAALCVTGPAVLARGGHTLFTAGWASAALLVVASLLLPLDPAPKSIIALTVGPCVGLVIHFGAILSGHKNGL